MKITEQNLNQVIKALRQCAMENEHRQTDTGAVRVTDICNDVADYFEAKKLKTWKEDVKTVNELSGLGPVKYVLIRDTISKEQEQDYLDRIDIVCPHDNNEEEVYVIRFLVLKYAPKILTDISENQVRITEMMMCREWMECFGTYYRDSNCRVTIEHCGDKFKVVFEDHFIYD